MEILKNISTGKAVRYLNGGVVCYKPYLQSWGFYLAKQNGTEKLYHRIYDYLHADFTTDAPTIDGNFGNLVIPLADLLISDTAEHRQTVKNAIVYVCADNPILNCADSVTSFGTSEGYLTSVTNAVMIASKQSEVRAGMGNAVKVIAKYVYGETNKNIGDTLTKQEEFSVAKALHDWIVSNSSYGTGNYYNQFAFTVLYDDGQNHTPWCEAFSCAYTYLCRLYGINCITVNGTSYAHSDGSEVSPIPTSANHAWNMVAFGTPVGTFPTNPDAWTPVDVTFDVHLGDYGETDTDKFFASKYVYYGHGGDIPTRINIDTFSYPVAIPTNYILLGADE